MGRSATSADVCRRLRGGGMTSAAPLNTTALVVNETKATCADECSQPRQQRGGRSAAPPPSRSVAPGLDALRASALREGVLRGRSPSRRWPVYLLGWQMHAPSTVHYSCAYNKRPAGGAVGATPGGVRHSTAIPWPKRIGTPVFSAAPALIQPPYFEAL